MPKSHRVICFAAVILCAGVLRAQEEAGTPGSQPQSRMTTSRLFSCELPSSWNAFEEEDALGAVFHALGPDDPTASYRTGLSVRWVEPEQTGYVEPKKAVESMRRSDRAVRRNATPVLPMRVAGLLARVFEVTETRVLPRPYAGWSAADRSAPVRGQNPSAGGQGASTRKGCPRRSRVWPYPPRGLSAGSSLTSISGVIYHPRQRDDLGARLQHGEPGQGLRRAVWPVGHAVGDS